jgi:hypothetical protein
MTERHSHQTWPIATVAALAGCLLVSGVATAAVVKPVVSAELVRNGGAETGTGVSDSSSIAVPAGWTTTGHLTAVRYGAPGGFPDAASSSAIAGGKQFFAGGPNAPVATASQVVAIPAAFRKDGLKVTAKLSAALGGYSSQKDDTSVMATFLTSSGAKLGTLTVRPVSHTQRGDVTKLVAGTRTTLLPHGTSSVKIVITARPLSGGYVDGYADNVSLHLLTS